MTLSRPSKILQTIFLSGFLLISSPLMRPQPIVTASKGCTLVLHVSGMRNQKGEIGAALYRSKDGWPEELGKALKSDSVKFHGNTAALTFHDLPPGQYAVAVIHDENVNNKLDRNFVGWPTEGFGFTRNPRVVLTAPTFNEAAIHVGCPSTETTVHLIYK